MRCFSVLRRDYLAVIKDPSIDLKLSVGAASLSSSTHPPFAVFHCLRTYCVYLYIYVYLYAYSDRCLISNTYVMYLLT